MEGWKKGRMGYHTSNLPTQLRRDLMNESIQAQLDAQLKQKRSAKVVEASDAPLLSLDVLERDKRLTDVVEINLRDQTARVVERSDAPDLTAEVLAEKGTPIKTVELVFDGQVWQIGVRHGKPMQVEVAHSRLLDAFKERIADSDELTAALLEARETAVKCLLVASMIVDPKTGHPIFSYQDPGNATITKDGGISLHPIEDCSQILLNALWEAYTAINFPVDDDIYQVTVRRGTPLDTALLLGETFETYPVGDLGKKFVDMSDDELDAVAARSLAQRRVLVASMLPDVGLSFLNGEEKKGAHPVEDVSEAVLATLFEAYRVSNIPAAGLDAISRFRTVGGDGAGKDASGESVGDEQGDGRPAESADLS